MDLTAPVFGSLELWHLLLLCAIPLFFVLSFNMLLGGRTATGAVTHSSGARLVTHSAVACFTQYSCSHIARAQPACSVGSRMICAHRWVSDVASHILVADESLANELKQQVALSLCCLYGGLCLCSVSVRSLTQDSVSLCSALAYCVICYCN